MKAGGFRFGLFGADYELARFSASGLAEPALAEERLPRATAGHAELNLGVGEERPEEGRLRLSLAAEHFTFGRTDTDFSLALQLPGGADAATARARRRAWAPTALLRPSRAAPAPCDPALPLGAGGSVHFPRRTAAGPGLHRGAGAGVDFSR